MPGIALFKGGYGFWIKHRYGLRHNHIFSTICKGCPIFWNSHCVYHNWHMPLGHLSPYLHRIILKSYMPPPFPSLDPRIKKVFGLSTFTTRVWMGDIMSDLCVENLCGSINKYNFYLLVRSALNLSLPYFSPSELAYPFAYFYHYNSNI